MDPQQQRRPSLQAGETSSIACSRCRHRKIKCNRTVPCSKCVDAGVACSFPGGGERARPASRRHVEALESQVKSLEDYIKKLASSDEATRAKLLNGVASTSPGQSDPSPHSNASHQQISSPTQAPDSGSLILARAREGKMCKLGTRKAVQFYGGTSLVQVPQGTSPTLTNSSPLQQQSSVSSTQPRNSSSPFPYSPKDEVCQRLMRNFFLDFYQYNMCIYREYFLRDYAASGGPYYSDALMFSICAVGSLISQDPELRKLSPLFASEAGSIVFNSLESPDLTTLQSLILLGHLEVGQGRSSKGWLFCGMAFRLTHEMGLHLDPTNWSTSNSESSVDREILRRVYWAVFLIDKQLSLYFGRPPALYPHEADVRNTIRIPYPPEWEDLLDSYISKGTSATAFEDGVRLVGCFIHQVELAKISHMLIVDVFENRHRQSDTAAAATTAQQVHTSLVRWLALLPQKLHWNQWTVGQVPSYVLHLHMLFHTCMIILHRPPSQHWDDEAVAKGEDVEICYQSLAAILRLLKSYQRYYRFEVLPLDFVQTLSAASEVIMLKRYMEKSSWSDRDIAKPVAQILEAMEAVQDVYPCIREIHQTLVANTRPEANGDGPGAEDLDYMELDLMDMLQAGAGPFPHWLPDESTQSGTVDLGFLVTDETLNELPPWDMAESELYR